MKPYLQKLQGETYCYRYAVNDVSMGIKWAMYDKEVKRHPNIIKRLQELFLEVNKFPASYRLVSDIDYNVISETIRIKEEAYELVCDI
jgi:hypothetical protein